MKWKVVAVGKPALTFARDGAAEYARRLRRYAPLEIVCVKEAAHADATADRVLKESVGYFRVVLDERGELPDTVALRVRLDALEGKPGTRGIAFLVGGAAGHHASVRAEADWMLALGRLTFQHELALVTLLEQLYRVQTIKRGEPYHRAAAGD